MKCEHIYTIRSYFYLLVIWVVRLVVFSNRVKLYCVVCYKQIIHLGYILLNEILQETQSTFINRLTAYIDIFNSKKERAITSLLQQVNDNFNWIS